MVDASIAAQRQQLAALEPELAGHYNHYIAFQHLDGELPSDTFIGNVNQNVITQLDTGKAFRGGTDLIAILDRYLDRAVTVYLKSYSIADGEKEPKLRHRPPIGDDDTPVGAPIPNLRDGWRHRMLHRLIRERRLPTVRGCGLAFETVEKDEQLGAIARSIRPTQPRNLTSVNSRPPTDSVLPAETSAAVVVTSEERVNWTADRRPGDRTRTGVLALSQAFRLAVHPL